MANTKNLYIGLMSGTSMDALDAALVSFTNKTPELLATASLSMPAHVQQALTKLSCTETSSIALLGETDTKLGHLFADTVITLLKNNRIDPAQISGIGSHGQTIFHHPHHTAPFTLQIGDPNIIAARTGITTVADFRRRDLALGGEAAPLAPAFHAYLFGKQSCNQWVLNIGGIANITHLSADKTQPIIGFDTGPGNTLLDLWHQRHHESPIDLSGAWAKSGKVDHPLLDRLLDDPYFKKSPPKSTGREYFNLTWLEQKLTRRLKPENIQATLTELTAVTIAQAINAHQSADVVWVCGGGAYNDYLMQRIATHCAPAAVRTTDKIGIAPKWIEAVAFAWLAKQTIEKKPGNLPSVTGASRESILGAVYFT